MIFDKIYHRKYSAKNFWKWFKKNSNDLFYFERNQEYLFDKLKTELNKIDSNLVFEFSSINGEGKREFVISADGIKSSFSNVSNLVNNAPYFDKWTIIAFRQPREIDQIVYENLVIDIKDVFFRFWKDKGKISIELNIKDFYEAPGWTGASFILLDNILGEYHTEMTISDIDKKKLNEDEINNLYPIKLLYQIVNDYHFECNN